MKLLKNPKSIRFIFYLLSFLISMICMFLILKSRGFYPFKDTTLFTLDMQDQYLEFYASLRYMLGGDNSPFLSWSRSLGGNYIGLFAYYIASPLALITVLFPLNQMPMAIVILTVLKIGLCSLSFAVFASYLWHRTQTSPGMNDEDNIKSFWKQFILLPLTVSYALISYNIVYSMCLMWLDGVILLPAILLGIEKILDGKKGLHYLLCLTALLYCNYYTGYMVGIFTAIYLLFRVLTMITRKTKKVYFNVLFRFTITSVFSLGLSCPLLIPVIKDLQNGKFTNGFYFPERTFNFKFTELFGQLTNGAYDTIRTLGKPSIYCGYLALLLTIVFFVVKKISLREKLGAALMVIFLALSLYITKLDVAWHGFQEPNFFPGRYAFVCSFFFIYLALRAVCCFSFRKITTILERKPLLESITAILLIIVALDLGINGRELFLGIGTEFGYNKLEDYETFLASSEPLVNQITEKDSNFYRINQCYEYSKNDAMLLGFNGMTHYSSTYNQAINTITSKLGLAQSWIWNSGFGSTPITDSLLAAKYVLTDKKMPSFYDKLQETDYGTASYENKNAISIAYSAPGLTLNPDLNNGNPFINQNTLLNTIAGTHTDYFTEYAYTTEPLDIGWVYTFTTDSTNPVYLHMKSNQFSFTEVYVNDELIGNYFSTETNCNLYLGTFAVGETVKVKVVPSVAITTQFATISQLHMDTLTDTLTALQTNGMDVTTHRNGTLSGTIYVPENEIILTSIPYDEAWTVKIDGKKVETKKFADAFLAIETNAGEHSISFSYVSPGIGIGLLIGIISLMGTLIYFLKPVANKR